MKYKKVVAFLIEPRDGNTLCLVFSFFKAKAGLEAKPNTPLDLNKLHWQLYNLRCPSNLYLDQILLLILVQPNRAFRGWEDLLLKPKGQKVLLEIEKELLVQPKDTGMNALVPY